MKMNLPASMISYAILVACVIRTTGANYLHQVHSVHRHHSRMRKDGSLPGISPLELPVEKHSSRALSLTDGDAKQLISMGMAALGENSVVANGRAWLGQDGPYTNKFANQAGEDLILVVWGPAGSWVNVIQPTITASLPAGKSLWVSFASGASGAWAAIYADTVMVNGQISNTWGEFTFGNQGVVDVSREVNMQGHFMSIIGPSCTTDMDTCVFVCAIGQTCTTNYLLLNCDNGSQAGATYGTFEGAPSGGCQGMGLSAPLKTTFI